MNKLNGTIQSIQSSNMMSLISIKSNEDIFSAIILEGTDEQLNYKKLDDVFIVFKETEVGIAKNLSGQISFRNRFKAYISNIEKGKLLTKIILNYKNKLITSIISTQSANDMQLQIDDNVEWLVKTNEVSLMHNPS